jgi:dethiobiotin synthetase
MTRSFYVTGTDTGIGKTLSSCTLLHALRAGGLRAIGMKPVASGCVRVDGEWRNEDALSLLAAGEAGIAYADVNPFALEHPLAPELAARDAGIEVELPPILAAHARLAARADAVVVEGVGGWAAPLSATLMQADLVHALRLPVVLVVGLRLGCLSHALLSARDRCRWGAAGGLDRLARRSGDGAGRGQHRDAARAPAGAVLGRVAACARRRSGVARAVSADPRTRLKKSDGRAAGFPHARLNSGFAAQASHPAPMRGRRPSTACSIPLPGRASSDFYP